MTVRNARKNLIRIMSRMLGTTKKCDSQIERRISYRLGIELCAPGLVVNIAAAWQAKTTASVNSAPATRAVASALLKQSPGISRVVALPVAVSKMMGIISGLSPIALRRALQPIACHRPEHYTLIRKPGRAYVCPAKPCSKRATTGENDNNGARQMHHTRNLLNRDRDAQKRYHRWCLS